MPFIMYPKICFKIHACTFNVMKYVEQNSNWRHFGSNILLRRMMSNNNAGTPTNLQSVIEKLGMELSRSDLEQYGDILNKMTKNMENIYGWSKDARKNKLPKCSMNKPSHQENMYNAWSVKLDIKKKPHGKLADKTVAVKDSISIAGIPMTCGSELLKDYVPNRDAAVVRSILDEGGRILGTATCEDLCFSGSSFTSSSGPVLNPHNTSHAAGGSSSGCAVLVATGEVDMAIGGDTAGSVRIPASWCGVVGMKPTHGLVPCTGAASLQPSLDHLGPMAANVDDCAILLEVIAGYDYGKDPCQIKPFDTLPYSTQLMNGPKVMKMGILKEGFKGCSDEVCSVVHGAISKLEKEGGVEVHEVSIPQHSQASVIYSCLFMTAAYQNVFRREGISNQNPGNHELKLHVEKHLKSRINALSPAAKLLVLGGQYIVERYGDSLYYEACQHVPSLNMAYNSALSNYDVLVMPTTRFVAPKLPPLDTSAKDYITQALNMTSTTQPFNITGHPALSINSGFCNGLPVGMMFAGKPFDDITVLRAAKLWEGINNNQAA